MSAFNSFAAESADSQNEDVTAVPEDETATSELADATAEQTEVAQEDDIAEQLGEEQEQVEDLGEAVAQESGGLTPQAARMLNLSLRRIVGKKHASKIIATENYTSSRSLQLEAKQIALEGIKDTLKAFWEAIKAQLKKFYNKVKSYFVKAFSAARKLSERAKKIQDKASETVGSIEDKSFSFSQTKTIAVDGKYNDPSALTTGLNTIRSVMEGSITVKKSDDYEDIIEKAQKLIETKITGIISDLKAGKDLDGVVVVSQASNIINELSKSSAGVNGKLTFKAPDEKLAKMYVSGDDKVSISQSLPGGKAIFAIFADVGNSNESVEALNGLGKSIKNTRSLLGNDKATARDVTEGDVKTLTTSQIDKICDDVIEIAETAYTYEKAWERRDKFQAKLEKEIDQIVKEVDREDSDKIDSRVQRVVRGYAESFSAAVRRRTSFESQFIGYALNTASAMLNYSERSLAQHKAK